MTLTNKTKQLIIHESFKCICRLDPIVCSNKQKWNQNKCRCECLINKECNNNKCWNPSNWECEYRKKAAYSRKECEEIVDTQNKQNNCNKKISRKLFVASSILFISVSVIVTGIFIHFYCKSKNNVLPYKKRKQY